MTVAFSNVCSLRNKRDELHQLIDEVDILAVAETWLTEVDEWHLARYIVYRDDRRGRAGGGCALAVKETIPHLRRDLTETGPNVQLVQIDLYLPHVVSVFCVYRSPQAGHDESISLLGVLTSAIQGKTRWIIVGDFNAPYIDWDSQTLTQTCWFDDTLLDWCETTAAYQHVCEPTRFRNGCKPSLLDLLFTPFANDVTSIDIRPPLGKSDHATLVATVSVRSPKPNRKFVRRYERMNVDNIIAHAKTLSWSGEHIEDRWLVIKSNVTLLENIYVPLIKTKGSNSRPWFSRKVKTWSNKKKRAWNRYKASPNHKRWQAYKHTRNTCIGVTREGRRNFEQRLAKIAKHNPKKLHGYVQSHSRLRNQVPRVLATQYGVADDDASIANEMCRFFLSVFRSDNGATPPTSTLNPHRLMADFSISNEETLTELLHLIPTKSPGPDGLHPALIKAIAGVLADPLTGLFNQSLTEGKVPSDWKYAIVVPIFKGKDSGQANNYRPVSLTCVLSKVLERILRRRICDHMLEHELLNPAQHGFVKGRSCLSNLLLALDAITEALDRGEEVRIGYLDFQKAFDSVNHRLLAVKVNNFGINPLVRRWISDFPAP